MLQLTSLDILLGKSAANKFDAIEDIARDLVEKGLVAEGYEKGMLAREQQNSTFLGNGIAIPHGTTDTRDLVNQTGVQIHHFSEGVDWGDGNTVYLAIGIAAKSDEHLGILKQLTHVLSADGVEDALKKAQSTDDILAILNAKNEPNDAKTQGLCFGEQTIIQYFPASDLVTLSAVCAAKLKQADAVSEAFIADLLMQSPTILTKGLALVASNKGVNQTSIAVITPEFPFEHQGEKIRCVLVVAAKDDAHLTLLKNLSGLIHTGKASDLFTASKEEVQRLLTEVRQPGISRSFTIKNPHGLHARPGATLVSVVKKFESKVWVANTNTESQQVNAKSLMKVIALGVKQGHILEFTANGSDAELALDAIGEAIESGLGEG